MISRKRPDPDSLLDVANTSRGHLKIYLGMVAGVGKTFAMLSDAIEQKKRGVDVVAGYIEQHGRKETEDLADELEQIPPLIIKVSNATFREFDLDASLKRKPELILVDELAHTNSDQLRHKKRWQDVDELLRGGINVATTVNVQHIESLQDVVAQITGIRVSETIPDSILSRADDIEVIDIPPKDLLQRLNEGKVYPPERVTAALENFFREGNLIALRELVLRKGAQRVDAQMQRYRLRNAVTDIWHTIDRIMVCVGPSPTASSLVRSAKRLAESMNAELLAVSLESSQVLTLPAAAREMASDAMLLAENLGAETIILPSQDMVNDIVQLASQKNVTGIVIGKSIRPKWRDLLSRSLVDEVLRRSSGINIYVMSLSAELQKPAIKTKTSGPTIDTLKALLFVALTTCISFLVDQELGLENVIMLYLVCVAWVSYQYSRLESVVASVAVVLAFDFFFVPPAMTFAVTDFRFIPTFVVFLIISLIISSLTFRLKAQSKVILLRERRTTALYELSRELLGASSVQEIGQILFDRVEKILSLKSALIISESDRGFVAYPYQEFFSESENAVASWSFKHKRPAGKTTDTLPGSKALYLPIFSAETAIALLALLPESGKRIEDMQSVDAILAQTSLALRRVMLEHQAQKAQVETESERIRNTLLSSISHDLRTPLATIQGSVSTLLSRTDLNQADRNDLLRSTLDQSRRLQDLVTNILDFTRIASGQLRLNSDWNSIQELIGSSLAEVPLATDRVEVRCPFNLELVYADGILLQQVFRNLIENFVEHTPLSARLVISATQTDDTTDIEFLDNGPGISPGEENLVFDKLYRSQNAPEGGFGLGLAICRAIMQAHNGSIRAVNLVGGGAKFIVSIPSKVKQPILHPEVFNEA